MKVLDECAPDLGKRVRSGKRVDEFVGGYARNFFRRPYGDGWALVGDAGASYEYQQATLEPPSPEALQLFGAIHESQGSDRRIPRAVRADQ